MPLTPTQITNMYQLVQRHTETRQQLHNLRNTSEPSIQLRIPQPNGSAIVLSVATDDAIQVLERTEKHIRKLLTDLDVTVPLPPPERTR